MSERSPDSISIDLANGGALDAVEPVAMGESIRLTVIEEIKERLFDSCPICGAPATDAEHVPPQSVGGKVMTRTCGPCNHRLGSHVEADLADWWDHAMPLPRFASSAVPGNRQAGRILVRTTPAGELLLLMNGRFDSAIVDMLKSGQVDLIGSQPDRNRYHLALLKHAYLAACMKLGVPEGDAADEVRRDLIAARDAPSRRDVPQSRLALGLTVMRSERPISADPPPLLMAIAHESTGDCAGVLLAGRVFVSWSSQPAPISPVTVPEQERFTLRVGGVVDGTVSSVRSS